MTTPNPYEAPTVDPIRQQQESDANWALALGIVAVFICAPLAGPFALVKGLRATRSGPSGKATIGMVLSGIGMGLSLLLWFVAIWQFFSPNPRNH